MKQFKIPLVAAATLVVAGLLTAGTGFVVGRASTTSQPSAMTVRANDVVPVLSQPVTGSGTIPGSFRDIVAKVMPSVVEIDVVDVVKQKVVNPFQFFFGPQNGQPQQQEQKVQGLGSGVIVRRTGNTVYVLTNNHVAGDAQKISIKLNDGREFTGKLVGKDPNKDLALVSFQTRDHNIPVATLGDSSSLRPGDWVLAIGNPMGFQSSVTAGIVSAVGRESTPGSGPGGFTDYIQTDAAINQGNSGGALVNMQGDVVGLNTWIASTSGGNIGLGFAIPINNAKSAINDFIVKGRVDYAWLGVTAGDTSPTTMKDLGLAGRQDASQQGALVHGVFQGSPASTAGLEPGDVITSIDGNPITDSADLVRHVANMSPGSLAHFAVLRNGKQISVSVRLNSRADNAKIQAETNKLWPGFAVAESDSGPLQGIVVASVDQGGPAASVLQQGDVVRKVNGTAVHNLREFYHQLNAAAHGQILFNLERNGQQIVVGLPT